MNEGRWTEPARGERPATPLVMARNDPCGIKAYRNEPTSPTFSIKDSRATVNERVPPE
jgi:hypothetical protein